jgi:hypothetical protein
MSSEPMLMQKLATKPIAYVGQHRLAAAGDENNIENRTPSMTWMQ